MNPTTLVSLVIANMIGAGVFTTSGFALGDLGTPQRVLAAWLTGGGLAFCGALSYGMLARQLPVSGGEYLFLSRNIHPMAGFVAGWISLLAGFTGAIAFAATTFEAYTLPQSSGGGPLNNVVASAVIISAALFHGFQVKHGTVLQNFAVALKLFLLVCFIAFALYSLFHHPWAGIDFFYRHEPAVAPFSLPAFAVTLMWVSFSYSGFNAAIYVASEARDARAQVPRAMVTATLIVILVYLLLNTIFVLAPSPQAIIFKNDVAAIAARAIGGEVLAGVIRIIIAIALFTSVSAMIMAGPRVYARMAEDGLMPKALRYTRAAPGVAIAVQASLAIVVVWITGLRELLSYLGITLSLSAAATVASLFVITKRRAVEIKGFTGYPWAPLLFVGFTLLFIGIAAIRNPWEVLAAVLTILSGAAVYRIFTRKTP
ncbi:MAG: APC family permease [Gammaproteobacteria bacterium]